MARRRRHSTKIRFKHYLLITLACAVVALAIHYLSRMRDQAQDYAEERLDEAVRKAVKAEVQEAVQEHQ
jgi:hypothetical protein